MSVGLVTITHDGIGSTIFGAADSILGGTDLCVRHLSFGTGDSVDAMFETLGRAVEAIDTGDGVLILTDLFGSTPCNIARRLAPTHHVRVLSGINLPMVLRVLTYARLDLVTLIERGADGARAGVIDCGPSGGTSS